VDHCKSLLTAAVGWGTLYAGVRFGVTLGVFFFASSAITKVGRCRLKPADRPELKARWLRNWRRPPMDHYFLPLMYGGGPLCSIQRLKATCDEALRKFAFNFNWRRFTKVGADVKRKIDEGFVEGKESGARNWVQVRPYMAT